MDKFRKECRFGDLLQLMYHSCPLTTSQKLPGQSLWYVASAERDNGNKKFADNSNYKRPLFVPFLGCRGWVCNTNVFL